uniref:Uncharacterized protein n=1 Tax=Solanum lycopersicum TaxID=4081 RepID=A0A3Q7JK34_SOLLC
MDRRSQRGVLMFDPLDTGRTFWPKILLQSVVISEKDFFGRKIIKKGNRWTEDEQRSFSKGLDFHGKGNWTNIVKNFVPSRTPTQVSSHAQKCLVRLLDANSNSNETKKQKKSSVFDLRIEKTEDTHQAMVPLINNQATHNVTNYMMRSAPTVMPLTWVSV